MPAGQTKHSSKSPTPTLQRFKKYQFASDDELLSTLAASDRQFYSASVHTIRSFASKWSDASFSKHAFPVDFGDFEENYEHEEGYVHEENHERQLARRNSDSDPL